MAGRWLLLYFRDFSDWQRMTCGGNTILPLTQRWQIANKWPLLISLLSVSCCMLNEHQMSEIELAHSKWSIRRLNNSNRLAERRCIIITFVMMIIQIAVGELNIMLFYSKALPKLNPQQNFCELSEGIIWRISKWIPGFFLERISRKIPLAEFVGEPLVKKSSEIQRFKFWRDWRLNFIMNV